LLARFDEVIGDWEAAAIAPGYSSDIYQMGDDK